MHVAKFCPDGDFLYDVEEECPECGSLIAINVDEKLQHLETVCPVCKKTLMICTMCDRQCDWKPSGCCMDKAHCTTIRVCDVKEILNSMTYRSPKNSFQRNRNAVISEISSKISSLVAEGSDG